MQPISELPGHGWITCRKCFPDPAPEQRLGAWNIVNDPAAWGSSRPRVLILGFSKGFTQSGASKTDRFEEVPFKGMRSRLSETLAILGVLKPAEDVSRRMVSTEAELAFGSLVRCSLSRFNSKSQRFECTGAIMPKAFTEDVSPIVQTCANTFLANLPSSVRLVVMLGTGDSYIKGCRTTMQHLHDKTFRAVNEVAHQAAGALWVHASHPSGLNGHHPAWVAGDSSNKQGRKRLLAQSAIQASLTS